MHNIRISRILNAENLQYEIHFIVYFVGQEFMILQLVSLAIYSLPGVREASEKKKRIKI